MGSKIALVKISRNRRRRVVFGVEAFPGGLLERLMEGMPGVGVCFGFNTKSVERLRVVWVRRTGCSADSRPRLRLT